MFWELLDLEDPFYSSFVGFFQFGISTLQRCWVGQNIMEPGIAILLDRTRFSILQSVLQVFGVMLAYLNIL